MTRRDILALLGSTAATWPLAARAQQPVVPVIGFLNPTAPEVFTDELRAFHRGLKEAGFVEGDNVATVYRWAEGEVDRLPALAADLVSRKVAVIASTGMGRGVRGEGGNHDHPHRLQLPKIPSGLGWSRASLGRAAT